MDFAVDITDLTICYRKLTALSRITAVIPVGKMTAVVGPNGSGKSTLLKAILNLIPLQSGSIRVFGSSFRQIRDKVSYVPQTDKVDWSYPLLVWEAVAMGRCRSGKFMLPLTAYDRKIIDQSLEKMGLSSLAHRPIGHLSGGQKQRVFLARALTREAELYLLDEPFVGVDEATEKVIKEHLNALKNAGKTLLIVHHNLDEVYNNFDWALLLNSKLIAFGPAKRVLTPEFIAEAYQNFLLPFLGGMGGMEDNKLCREV